jgi:hypothetical protein
MRNETITCNMCGVVKQTTNHWFVIETADNGTAIISIYRSEDHNVGGQSFDVCGAAHVLQAVSKLLNEPGKIPKGAKDAHRSS